MEENTMHNAPLSTDNTLPPMQNAEGLEVLNAKLDAIKHAMAKIIVGKDEIIDLVVVAILADGHILLEGMPGVAKTLIAKTAAKLLDVQYNRIQFTPDLMPSDVIGTSIFNPALAKFEFIKGPIFSNIVLIDEINRAPAKTQAALFEVMEERHITVDGTHYPLDKPFLIIATQNPVEHEGTYRLPEAQLDRFLFKITMGYPNLDEEIAILEKYTQNNAVSLLQDLNAIISAAELHQLKDIAKDTYLSPEILQYIAALVTSTRQHKDIYLGASPRASLALLNASKAYAAINGRSFVIPEDIIYLAKVVLAHRIVLMPEAEMEGYSAEDIIDSLLKTIPVPR